MTSLRRGCFTKGYTLQLRFSRESDKVVLQRSFRLCVCKFSSNWLEVNSRVRGCVRTVLIGCVHYAMDARITVRNYAVNPPLCPLRFHDYLAFLVQFLLSPLSGLYFFFFVFYSLCRIYFISLSLSLSRCV